MAVGHAVSDCGVNRLTITVKQEFLILYGGEDVKKRA